MHLPAIAETREKWDWRARFGFTNLQRNGHPSCPINCKPNRREVWACQLSPCPYIEVSLQSFSQYINLRSYSLKILSLIKKNTQSHFERESFSIYYEMLKRTCCIAIGTHWKKFTSCILLNLISKGYKRKINIGNNWYILCAFQITIHLASS